MKIQFLIQYPLGHNPKSDIIVKLLNDGRYDEASKFEEPPFLVDNWQSIRKIQGAEKPSHDLYLKYQLLANNRYFLKEVRNIRSRLDIPAEGLSFDECKKYDLHNVTLNEEVDRILHEYTIDQTIRKMGFKSLILANFVGPIYPDDENIYYYFKTKDEGMEFEDEFYKEYSNPTITELGIRITSEVGKSDLYQYIKDHWDELESLIKKLTTQKLETKKLHDKGLYIYTLKTQNPTMTFRAITDILETNNIDEDEAINENNIKMVYTRTKKRIEAVMCKNK